MIRLILFLLLITIPQAAVADDAASQQDKENKPITQPGDNEQQQSTSWPYPFTPSQDVGADSQVTFPTDI